MRNDNDKIIITGLTLLSISGIFAMCYVVAVDGPASLAERAFLGSALCLFSMAAAALAVVIK